VTRQFDQYKLKIRITEANKICKSKYREIQGGHESPNNCWIPETRGLDPSSASKHFIES
jgi:hypothetical protein